MSGVSPVSSSSYGYYDPNEMQCVQEEYDWFSPEPQSTPAPAPAPTPAPRPAQSRPVTANFSNPVVQNPSASETFAEGFVEGMFSWVPAACGLIGGAIGGPEQDAGYDWDGGDTDIDTDSDSDTDTDTDVDTDSDTDTDTDTTPNVCDNYPGAFGLSSPTNSAFDVDLTPTLSWDASVDPDLGDSVSYCVTLDNDATFASPLVDECDITATSYAVTSPLSYDTQYYWRVTAGDTCEPSNVTPAGNNDFSFTTVDAGVCESSPGVFDLTDPADTATAVSITPTLNWEDAVDPDLGDSVTYCVQVDNSSDFSSPIVDECDLTVSQYTVPTALSFETLYYWRAIAADSCIPANETQSTSDFSFTTADAGPCETFPGAFDLVSPPNGSSGITTVPVLDWEDSTDPDTSDSVIYCVEVDNNSSFASPEVDQCGLTSSQYTVPASILSASTTYYWKVRAIDLCSQETPNTLPNYSFTTEDSCIPYSFSDTDFTAGTLGGGAVVNAGSLSLAEDSSAWTYKYEGDVLPTASGWSQNGSFVSSGAGGGIYSMSTVGSNTQGYYSINPGFNNTNGSVVDIGVRINVQDDSTHPSNAGFIVLAEDNSKTLGFTFYTDAICEPYNTGSCYAVDNTVLHNYRITFQGSNFMLYDDGSTAIDGTGLSGMPSGGTSSLSFGDRTTNPDSYADIDYLYYYNSGSSLPYFSPGTYIGTTVNTGVVDYYHGGATISWNPTSNPGGTVSASVRAGNIADLSAVSWTDVTGNPATIPGSVSGQYMQWMVTLTSGSSTPMVDDVTGGRTCP